MASSPKSRTLVLEPSADTEWVTAAPTPANDECLCPACGDPLAWHEQVCPPAGPAPQPSTADGSFVYAVGQPVRPAGTPIAHRIVWRGQVKERRPDTGWLYRVNVYRLDDGYWDCYHEQELQAA